MQVVYDERYDTNWSFFFIQALGQIELMDGGVFANILLKVSLKGYLFHPIVIIKESHFSISFCDGG